MEIPIAQLPPGDPRLVDAIVGQLKSKGIFDKFRKECLADVDTKPAFLNLRQRVDGQVKKFLDTKTWKNDLNKNQLRDGVRKNIQESGILDTGIDALINQVVNPKIKPLILPLVEDTVYNFLQIEKPKRDLQEYDRQLEPPQFHRPPPLYAPHAPVPQNYPPYPPIYQEIPPPVHKTEISKEPPRPLTENENNNSTTMDNSSVSSESEVSMDEKPQEEPKPPSTITSTFPAPPTLPSEILPMETDVISSGDDDILARDSPDSTSSLHEEKNLGKEIKMEEDNAVDSFDSARGETEANMATAVEKMSIKDETNKDGLEVMDSEKESTVGCLPLFDNRSLDSISSNTSGLSFSPTPQNKSFKEAESEVKQSENSAKSVEDLRSTQSTPLVDEKSPVQDTQSSESSKSWTPYTLPKDLQSSERVTIASFASFSTTDSARVVEGASPVSADDSQGSLDSNTNLESKDSASKDVKTPKSDKSEGEISSSSSSSSDDPKTSSNTRTLIEQDVKQGKNESVLKSSHRSEGREHEKSKEKQHKERRHSKDRERRRSKSSKHDDHSSHHDKDKHHRRDKDDDKDRDRHGKGHHSSSGSSNRTTSGEGSSSKDHKRDKGHERSSDHKSHSKSHSSSHSKTSSGSHSKSHHSSSSSKSSSKSSHSNDDSKSNNKYDYKSSRKSESKEDRSSKSERHISFSSSEDKTQKTPAVEHKNNGQISSERCNSPSKSSLDSSSKPKIDHIKSKPAKIVKVSTLKEDDTFALHLTNDKKDVVLPKPTTSLKTVVNKTMISTNVLKGAVDENKNKIIEKNLSKDKNGDVEACNKNKILDKENTINKMEKANAKTIDKCTDGDNKVVIESLSDTELTNKNTKVTDIKAKNKETSDKDSKSLKNNLESKIKTDVEDKPPIKMKINVKNLRNKNSFTCDTSESSSDESDTDSSDVLEVKRAPLRKRTAKNSKLKSYSKSSLNGFKKIEGKTLMKSTIVLNGLAKSIGSTEIVLENPSPPPKVKSVRSFKKRTFNLAASSSEESGTDTSSKLKDDSFPKLKKVTIPLFNISNDPLYNNVCMTSVTSTDNVPVTDEENKDVQVLNNEKSLSPIREVRSLRSKKVLTINEKLIPLKEENTSSNLPAQNSIDGKLLFDSNSDEDYCSANSVNVESEINQESMLNDDLFHSSEEYEFEGFEEQIKTPRLPSKRTLRRRCRTNNINKPKKVRNEELVVLCDSDSSDMELSVVKFCDGGNSKNILKTNDFEGFCEDGSEDSASADQKLKDYLAKFSFGSMVQLNDFISVDSDEDTLGEESTIFFNKRNTTKSVIEEIASMKDSASSQPETISCFNGESELEHDEEFTKDSESESERKNCSVVLTNSVDITHIESSKPFKKRKLSTMSDDSFSTPKKVRKENPSDFEKSSVEEIVSKDILNTYSLLTPEEDRSSSKDYEVDLSQGNNSYSPLSPASDSSSEDVKAKLKLSGNSGRTNTLTCDTNSS